MANLVDDQAAFTTILTSFGLQARARQRFCEDYPTIYSLMNASSEDVKTVIMNQNKVFRFHVTIAQRAYINQEDEKRIKLLRKWAICAIKEGGANYLTVDAPTFNQVWIDGIEEEFTGSFKEATDSGTELSVKIPKFTGTNWYEVKAALTLALQAYIGRGGVPLSYLIREERKGWEATEDYETLEHRRIDTKDHAGPDYNADNMEFYRILSSEFNGTTLQDVVRGINRSNGTAAWTAILNNVEGAHYKNELRRKAEDLASTAFYDPTKHFSFESYFEKHTKYHDMMSKAGDPVSETQKIQRFTRGIRCNTLQYIIVSNISQTNAMSFTTFYNTLHEQYRMLVDQKQLKPASIYKKRNISEISTDRGGRGRSNYYGGQGRGRGGRGRGGRGYGNFDNRNNNNGRGGRGYGRGFGRGHFDGRGRGRGRGYNNDSRVNWSVLPPNLDINGNLTFDDHTWYNFSPETKDEIQKLRRMQNTHRRMNSLFSGGSTQGSVVHDQRSLYGMSIGGDNNGNVTPSNDQQQSSQDDNMSSISTNNAGAAFGRRGTRRGPT